MRITRFPDTDHLLDPRQIILLLVYPRVITKDKLMINNYTLSDGCHF